jgi:glutamine synthetase
MPDAAVAALRQGVSMVSTLVLKDSSDRTAYSVFEEGGTDSLPIGFGQGNNLVLLPDPASLVQLPWAERTGLMRCQPWFQDARPLALDSRRVLQSALEQLAGQDVGLICGLEIEFHIYRITDQSAQLAPQAAGWPGEPPALEMIHPGFHLLSEQWADMADRPLAIVRRVAQGLSMPLTSLEIEMGPSQVEAVFAPTDALVAADQMVLFRSAVRQALRREGYYASFVCRPPFEQIMSSGWHLHQSVVDARSGLNLFCRQSAAESSTALDAEFSLSERGEHWLAGLLTHARASTVFCAPTINAYARFRPNMLAPQSIVWGRDNRGAMLRVVGAAGDASSRIENRLGEPAANPYLYIAAQVHSGLEGWRAGLRAPQATLSPYAASSGRLPVALGEALDALLADSALVARFGDDFVRYLVHIKRAELARWRAAPEKTEFERREYFSRI